MNKFTFYPSKMPYFACKIKINNEIFANLLFFFYEFADFLVMCT